MKGFKWCGFEVPAVFPLALSTMPQFFSLFSSFRGRPCWLGASLRPVGIAFWLIRCSSNLRVAFNKTISKFQGPKAADQRSWTNPLTHHFCICANMKSYPTVTFITKKKKNTVLCIIKVNINTIELTVHTSCYCFLDLPCVIGHVCKFFRRLTSHYRIMLRPSVEKC